MCYQVFILFEKGGNLSLKRVFEIPLSDGKRKAMAIEIFFAFYLMVGSIFMTGLKTQSGLILFLVAHFISSLSSLGELYVSNSLSIV